MLRLIFVTLIVVACAACLDEAEVADQTVTVDSPVWEYTYFNPMYYAPPKPVHCAVDCATLRSASAGMHECNLLSNRTNHVLIALTGHCDATWLPLPHARYITLQGPATVRGGALHQLIGSISQSIIIDSIHFDGANTTDHLFSPTVSGIESLVIGNSTFSNWAGDGLLRARSTRLVLTNISMENIVGYMFHCSSMTSFRAEDVVCNNCAQSKNTVCGHVSMDWCGDSAVVTRVSCIRPPAPSASENHGSIN